MGAINLFKALRLVALRDVILEPPDYHLRYVFRWYSRNFHVPLPQVSELPLDEVLQAFYESRYEDMNEEEREAERELLLETDEQREKRLRKEEADKISHHSFREMAKAIAAEQSKNPPKEAAPIAPVKEPTTFMSKLPEASLDTQMSPVTKAPPDIKMEFVSKEEFEKLLAEEGVGIEEDDPREGNNLPLKPPASPPTMK